jgi:hypothetical protein
MTAHNLSVGFGLNESVRTDRAYSNSVVLRSIAPTSPSAEAPIAEAPTSMLLYAVWTMKDGINELERSRTIDKT